MGNHLFVIFAVLDVSCAVNLCINHSFFTFIIMMSAFVKRKINGTQMRYIVALRWRRKFSVSAQMSEP